MFFGYKIFLGTKKKIILIFVIFFLLKHTSYSSHNINFELAQGVNKNIGMAYIYIGWPIDIYKFRLTPGGSWRTWYVTHLNQVAPYAHGLPFRDIFSLGLNLSYSNININYKYYCTHGVYSDKNSWEKRVQALFGENENDLKVSYSVNFKELDLYPYAGIILYENDIYAGLNFNFLAFKLKYINISICNDFKFLIKNNIITTTSISLTYNNTTALKFSYFYNNISHRKNYIIIRWNNDFYLDNIWLIAINYLY